ncbi:MAG TPA: MEDS domain-containing protein, partial [Nitrososphaeraceae archaeon]|nr:MEDS domain-containing protein [Nitrososphaeraceae archaeon]
YKITFVNWNDVSTFITNFDDTKRKNLELIIFDIVTATEDSKTNQISTTTIREIKKIFYDTRIFFILPFESMIDNLLSIGICKQEDIRLQPFSVFDIIDLISITKKNERLDRLQLKDHCMYIYSSVDDKVKDAIKFLKIGIENNEMTLLLLSREIEPSYMLCQIALHDIDISKLQNNGLLKIANTEEYYLSFNQKDNKINTVTVDNKTVHRNFFNLADQVSRREGINGLRIFAMLDCFFEHGLVDELVDYECETQFRFSKPILGICAYNDKHIAQLSEDQIRKLVLNHSSVWI